MMVTYQCIISGRVQGVFYRASVQEMASEAKLNGYVMNLPGGDVEASVTLESEKQLPLFLDILKAGSPYSHVENITTRQINLTFTNDFVINH